MPASQSRRDPEAEQMAVLAGDLRVAIGKLQRRLREEATVGDFSWSQLKVLSRLERDGPATVTALAQAEGVRSQSMGATIAVLKDAGLISGAPDPTDGRQTVLHLTASARQQFAAGRSAREDWLFKALGATLSADERTQLAASVALLTRLAGS